MNENILFEKLSARIGRQKKLALNKVVKMPIKATVNISAGLMRVTDKIEYIIEDLPV